LKERLAETLTQSLPQNMPPRFMARVTIPNEEGDLVYRTGAILVTRNSPTGWFGEADLKEVL